jgi:hypothetical protein
LGDGGGAVLFRDPERDADGRRRRGRAEHEARLFRRAAMDEGIDAERAMFAISRAGTRSTNSKPGRHISEP